MELTSRTGALIAHPTSAKGRHASLGAASSALILAAYMRRGLTTHILVLPRS